MVVIAEPPRLTWSPGARDSGPRFSPPSHTARDDAKNMSFALTYAEIRSEECYNLNTFSYIQLNFYGGKWPHVEWNRTELFLWKLFFFKS